MQTGGKKILTFHFFFTLSERTEIAAKKNNVNTPLYIVPLPLVSHVYERNNRTSVAVICVRVCKKPICSNGINII